MSAREGKAAGRSRTTAVRPAPPADDPDAVRADIEQTRAELGDSVQELAGRADVKARAKERAKQKAAEVGHQAAQVKDRAKGTAQVATVRTKDTAQVAAARGKDAARHAATRVRQRPVPYAGVVAGLAAVVAAVALVRRRAARGAQSRRWWSR